jgi:hypothetical protein
MDKDVYNLHIQILVNHFVEGDFQRYPIQAGLLIVDTISSVVENIQLKNVLRFTSHTKRSTSKYSIITINTLRL